MSRSIISLFILGTLTLTNCTNGQTKDSTSLAPQQFAEKMAAMPNAPVIDVRTPDEFAAGHIKNAENIDWNGSGFEKGISKFDKSQAVFVYCLSGGRSSAAADKMRKEGFSEVYELRGGMVKWRADGLPSTTAATSSSTGLTKARFDELTKGSKPVLVDFYAEWCAPCQRMKPYLKEIEQTMDKEVTILRINADENVQLCQELHVDALPLLQLYHDGQLTWSHTGYIEKDAVVKQLTK